MKALRFGAILKTTLWGGEEVTALKQLTDAPPQVGESWEISGVPGDETTVSEGELRGLTLAQLTARYGAAFLGRANLARYGENFPLLVKFMSTARDLSVQVHPDNEMARRMGRPFGKSEMQYIVRAEPEAHFYAGFNADFSAEGYERSLADGTLVEHLRCHTSHAGDCFFIPAGHIHCIGAGNFLIEIQQSSNDTFRVYDFDRCDAQGRRRELHVAQAREALDFKACATHRVGYALQPEGCTPLVDCPEFTVRLYELTRPLRADYAALDSFTILVAFEGDALLRYDEGEISLRAGESLLFPATTQFIEMRPGAHGFKALETFCR